MTPERSLDELSEKVIACRRCPRLVEYRESVPARKAFSDQEYWRKPVPGFGDPEARIVVMGLAPAAHGGERTGRVFTGDESARFLYRSLHDVGLANKPTSESRDDGLRLRGCYVTAAVKCAPPRNRPTPEEFRACSTYLDAEMESLPHAVAVVALGQLAFNAVVEWAGRRGAQTSGMVFKHGCSYHPTGLPRIYACYHPSPRNTYTGLLTRHMMTEIFKKVIRERLN